MSVPLSLCLTKLTGHVVSFIYPNNPGGSWLSKVQGSSPPSQAREASQAPEGSQTRQANKARKANEAKQANHFKQPPLPRCLRYILRYHTSHAY